LGSVAQPLLNAEIKDFFPNPTKYPGFPLFLAFWAEERLFIADWTGNVLGFLSPGLSLSLPLPDPLALLAPF